jgi:phosphoribosylanthranilate isomerase
MKMIKHPQFHGVDLNSHIEIEPGLKDIEKLKNAFKLLR